MAINGDDYVKTLSSIIFAPYRAHKLARREWFDEVMALLKRLFPKGAAATQVSAASVGQIIRDAALSGDISPAPIFSYYRGSNDFSLSKTENESSELGASVNLSAIPLNVSYKRGDSSTGSVGQSNHLEYEVKTPEIEGDLYEAAARHWLQTPAEVTPPAPPKP